MSRRVSGEDDRECSVESRATRRRARLNSRSSKSDWKRTERTKCNSILWLGTERIVLKTQCRGIPYRGTVTRWTLGLSAVAAPHLGRAPDERAVVGARGRAFLLGCRDGLVVGVAELQRLAPCDLFARRPGRERKRIFFNGRFALGAQTRDADLRPSRACRSISTRILTHRVVGDGLG